jgi:chemotaxis protein methyltransferase CheR
MIERCQQGRYTQFEVNRGLPAPLLLEHFEQVGRDWVIRADLRSLIDFRVHNLMDSWADIPNCDIVLLRNVLIYFTVDVKAQILTQLRKDVLRPGGALFLGSSETTINLDDSYEREKYERTVLYRAPTGADSND